MFTNCYAISSQLLTGNPKKLILQSIHRYGVALASFLMLEEQWAYSKNCHIFEKKAFIKKGPKE